MIHGIEKYPRRIVPDVITLRHFSSSSELIRPDYDINICFNSAVYLPVPVIDGLYADFSCTIIDAGKPLQAAWNRGGFTQGRPGRCQAIKQAGVVFWAAGADDRSTAGWAGIDSGKPHVMAGRPGFAWCPCDGFYQ